MGKSTISMAIFHSNVKLPEGLDDLDGEFMHGILHEIDIHVIYVINGCFVDEIDIFWQDL